MTKGVPRMRNHKEYETRFTKRGLPVMDDTIDMVFDLVTRGQREGWDKLLCLKGEWLRGANSRTADGLVMLTSQVPFLPDV